MKMDDGKYNAGKMRIDKEEGDDCSDTVGGDGSYKRDVSGWANFNMDMRL